MRISDWSSDVCSSDLIQPLDAVLIVRVDNSAGPRIFHHRHIFPDGVIGFHIEPPPIRLHRRAYAVEIGRESCRERVCQSGEISVVAVSLKQKIRHTQTSSVPADNIIQHTTNYY